MKPSIWSIAVLVVPLACAAAAPNTEAPAPASPPSSPMPTACTEIGCTNGLGVALEPNAAWPAGAYTFELELDGERVSCSGALPLPSCDAGPALTCTGTAVRIGESGCALPPNAHGFSDIQMDGAPKHVRIRVLRDGRELSSHELRPTYRRMQPNGPNCEPVCDTANESVRVL